MRRRHRLPRQPQALRIGGNIPVAEAGGRGSPTTPPSPRPALPVRSPEQTASCEGFHAFARCSDLGPHGLRRRESGQRAATSEHKRQQGKYEDNMHAHRDGPVANASAGT